MLEFVGSQRIDHMVDLGQLLPVVVLLIIHIPVDAHGEELLPRPFIACHDDMQAQCFGNGNSHLSKTAGAAGNQNRLSSFASNSSVMA